MKKTLIVLGSALLLTGLIGCEKKPSTAPATANVPATQPAETKPADTTASAIPQAPADTAAPATPAPAAPAPADAPAKSQ